MTAPQMSRHTTSRRDGADIDSEALIEVDGLSKSFDVRNGKGRATLRAVERVDLSIRRGETLALVGESGCGKSTLGRCIIQLERPTQGRVMFNGTDLAHLSGAERRRSRRRLQMIFQDPTSSLTPRMTIGRLLEEPLRVHKLRIGKLARKRRVHDLLEMVGLRSAMADRYPHEFSGGQRQRVAIARVLAHEPDFVVCDEAVSALDVSVQAQVLALLKQLQAELGLTYLFITHDLAAAHYVADRVCVMYLGHIVESGPASDVFDAPAHPYTEALLAAVPIPDPTLERARSHAAIIAEPGSPIDKPDGCVFNPRCIRATTECLSSMPTLSSVGDGSRSVACIWPGNISVTEKEH